MQTSTPQIWSPLQDTNICKFKVTNDYVEKKDTYTLNNLMYV